MKTKSPSATREKPCGSYVGKNLDSEHGSNDFKELSAWSAAAKIVLAERWGPTDFLRGKTGRERKEQTYQSLSEVQYSLKSDKRGP